MANPVSHIPAQITEPAKKKKKRMELPIRYLRTVVSFFAKRRDVFQNVTAGEPPKTPRFNPPEL